MKNTLRVFLPAALVILIMTGCSSSSEMKPGSWQEQKTDSEMVVDAHEYLVKEMKERKPGVIIGPVKKAYTQVVSGYKVKMLCPYTQNKESGDLTAVVYVDIDRNYVIESADFN